MNKKKYILDESTWILESITIRFSTIKELNVILWGNNVNLISIIVYLCIWHDMTWLVFLLISFDEVLNILLLLFSFGMISVLGNEYKKKTLQQNIIFVV